MVTSTGSYAARPSIALTLTAPLRPVDRERQTRRLLNVAAAAAGLILALPLMLVIAALIKLTSRGPVLFAQQRIGLDRRGASRPGGENPPPPPPRRQPLSPYKF